jgi:hypothetical protein
MVGETKMNTNGRVRSKDPKVMTSFADLAHDVIELAELQSKLFTLDVKSSAQKTRTSLLLAAAGACVLLGSIPVALFALAEVFVEQLGWSEAGGFAVATLIGLVISGGLLAAGWMRFKSGLNTMHRSREELSRNIAWIKASLRSPPAASSESEPVVKPTIRPTPK